MRHKLLALVLAVVVIASLVVAGCAKPAPAPAEPIKLRVAYPNPPATVFNWGMLEPWAEMIEERTAAIGKPVEITIFPGGTLVKHADQYKAVVDGISDITSMINTTDVVSGGGLATVFELPLLFPSATVAAQVAQEMFDTCPELSSEYAEVKLLWFQPTGVSQVHSRTKLIKTLEDFEGLRAFVMTSMQSDIVQALGAVPVSVWIPEVYISLQKGVVDVAIKEWEPAVGFKWYEVTKYRTSLPRGLHLGATSTVMNWDSWNRLPPDVQEIFEELSGMHMAKFSGEAMDKADMQAREFIKEYDKRVGNPEIYYIPENEFQRWVEAVNPVYDKWIKEMEDKGLPAGDTLEKVRRLIEEYSE